MNLAPALRPILAIAGVRPDNSFVSFENDKLHLHMGDLFREHIPLAQISLARSGRRSWVPRRGGLTLPGSGKGMVELALARPLSVRLLGRPFAVQRLTFSVDGAQEFLAELLKRQPSEKG